MLPVHVVLRIYRRWRRVCSHRTIEVILVNFDVTDNGLTKILHNFGSRYLFVVDFVFASGPCYKRQMQPLNRADKNPFIRKPHSIRLVEIPSSTEVTRGVKLSIEKARHAAPYYAAAALPK